MPNTNWLLESDRATVERYQRVAERVTQLERDWVSVPFHWDAGQLATVRSVSETYQAVCAQEIDWRMKQYSMFNLSAKDTANINAEFDQEQARNYWNELREWREAAMYARGLVQRVERGVTVYQAYQERANAEHAAYLQKIGAAV